MPLREAKLVPTTSCCPVCRRTLPAEKVTEGNQVNLNRVCPEHGEFSVLVSKDAERFFDKTFVSPGKSVAERQTGQDKGCPDDCGLCPNHKQHMCSSIVEITGHCDLRCPVCYFGQFDSPHISLEEFGERVETLLRTENGHLDVLQLSGGEPTLHPRFVEILDDACSRDINRVLLNTNGLSLLRDESVYRAVKRQKDRVEVYLQFDGFNREANKLLRGRDLLEEKLALVTKLDEDEVKICLAVTMVQENLTEIGAILDFACRTRNVTGVTFQRFTRAGNGAALATEAILAEDILLGIAATQAAGHMTTSCPCPAPTRTAPPSRFSSSPMGAATPSRISSTLPSTRGWCKTRSASRRPSSSP